MLIDRLHEEAKQKGPVCVGLDTRIEYLPSCLEQSSMSIEDKVFEFNQSIIDETKDVSACYKLQIACYEALGLEGLNAYKRTLKYLRDIGKIAIGDIKRGDILSTAQMYAKAHFKGDFEADFITVNPYMGIDAVSPYFDYLKSGSKGLFILIRTSNKSSEDLQELEADKKPLYLHTASKVSEWGKDFIGTCGYSLVGGVIGLTYPDQFDGIREEAPKTFFLIPGYGAQGGTGKDVARILKMDRCAVVNSSRGIIKAHKGVDETSQFAKQSRNAVLKMKEDILKWL